MKKPLIVIGATLLIGTPFLANDYIQAKKSEEKAVQYELYLSNVVTNDTAKLVGSTNTLSSYIDNVIKEKKINEEQRSMMIGQMFEMMDISSKTEKLAIAVKKFDNDSPAYNTANTLYSIGLYLAELDASKELPAKDLEKLLYIQSFTTAWKAVANKEVPNMNSEDGFDTYFEKYEETMMTKSTWKDVINGMDEETTRLLSEKELKSMDSFLKNK